MSLAHQIYDPCQVDPSWLEVWGNINAEAQLSIARVAAGRGILEFHLRLRTLLQLPRHPVNDLLNQAVVDAEVESEAGRIANRQSGFREFLFSNSVYALTKRSACLREVCEFTARIIHEKFHYIESFHAGRHFGVYLRGESRPAALATVSPMDVLKLRHYLPEGGDQRSLLLSRVFAFPWAPKNSLSWLLGAVARELRREGDFDNLFTWVNPNLGFHASSYRAANWSLVGTEPVVYRYIDGVYVTARQLHQCRAIASSRLSFSRFSLAPLEVWRYVLRRENYVSRHQS